MDVRSQPTRLLRCVPFARGYPLRVSVILASSDCLHHHFRLSATARRILGTTLNGTAPAEIWFTAPVRYRSGSGFRSMSSSSSVSSRSTVIAFQPGAPGVRVEGAAEKPLDENGTRGRARRGEDHVAVAAAHGGVEEVVAVEPREEVTRDHGRPQVGVVVRR